MEIKESVRIHDFRFELNLKVDLELMYADIMSVTTYFIGIDNFGVKLSRSGSTYVLDAYLEEIQDNIDNIISKLTLN